MDPNPHLLLVEDDSVQRLLLAAYLRQEGFEVGEARGLTEARARLVEAGPALVLLDLNLPDGDGLELARELRRRDVPLILLSNREEDRILGLELGADDYVAKPYDPRELAARIANVLRRCCAALPGSSRHVGSYHLDVERRLMTTQTGAEVALTRGEFDLLAELASVHGRVLGRAQLAEAINPEGETASHRSVDVLVSRLRHKLEADPAHPHLLVTVQGLGYRLGP